MAGLSKQLGPMLSNPYILAAAAAAALVGVGIIAFKKLADATKAFREETGLLRSQTEGLDTTIMSSYKSTVALGASIIERHFTDKRNRKGPDIVCSMDEKDARELISNMKLMKKCLSPGAKKEAHPQEKVTIDFAFASVVSIADIKKHKSYLFVQILILLIVLLILQFYLIFLILRLLLF